VNTVMTTGSCLILRACRTTVLPRRLNSNLNKDGEELFLMTPGEVIVDHITFPKQRVAISYE
jgi:hypothetical protein